MNGLEIVSFLLIVLTALSYLPQIHHLTRSSIGIPVLATSLSALVAQGQVATTLFRPNWAFNVSTQSNLNRQQLIVQWVGALICFALAITSPRRKVKALLVSTELQGVQDEVEQDGHQPLVQVTIHHMQPSLYARPVLVSMCLVVTHLVAVWAAMSVTYSNDRFAWSIIWSVDQVMFMQIWTVLSIAAPALQIRHIVFDGESTASFSKFTLSSQVFLFTGLAILWPHRTWTGLDDSALDGLELAWSWYLQGGFTCLNNAIYALGQAGVLAAVLHRERKSIELE